jgi:hypothetical protein
MCTIVFRLLFTALIKAVAHCNAMLLMEFAASVLIFLQVVTWRQTEATEKCQIILASEIATFLC